MAVRIFLRSLSSFVESKASPGARQMSFRNFSPSPRVRHAPMKVRAVVANDSESMDRAMKATDCPIKAMMSGHVCL